MLLTEFIHTHENWEELLTAPPYSLCIRRDGGYIMFSYNQIESDFCNALVRECRGVILHEKTFKPVCVPFYKFGNYGENYVPEIDWSSARVQEKIDGSIIKVWYDDGKWRVSTSGNIDAYKAELTRTDLFEDGCTFGNFGELFDAARKISGLDYDKLDKNNTYMFELIGPYNKVIVLYKELGIYHIGTRSNVTLEEIDTDIGIRKPAEYAFGSLDMCIAAARGLPDDKEGYVVVDKHYNRIKVKNPVYVALHHMKTGAEPSLSSLIGVIRKNEIGEYLNYFPEYASYVRSCKLKIDRLIGGLESGLSEIKDKRFDTQKDFALAVKDRPFCGFYFDWRRTPSLTPKQWFWSMTDDKIRSVLINMNINTDN